ncbi:MAG: hypothetical protein RBG13Loki_3749 [Promethearchaeota archaeon CR_4]|nr:MAG: hypothetical protein RBG13Loki_3749 [Candidatus Lokiarchaeota archaeon CR_4]
MEPEPTQSSLRWRKAREEVTSAIRMRDLGLDPFVVMDELFQGMVDLLRAGLRENNPTASEDEIVSMMREQARIYTRWRRSPSTKKRRDKAIRQNSGIF